MVDTAHGDSLYVGSGVTLNSERIAAVTPTFTDGQNEIEIAFDREGAMVLERLTAANIGQRIAILHRGVLVSAPMVRAVIAGGRANVSFSDAARLDGRVEALIRGLEAAGVTIVE